MGKKKLSDKILQHNGKGAPGCKANMHAHLHALTSASESHGKEGVKYTCMHTAH